MNPEIPFEAFYEKHYSAMVSYCSHSFGLQKQDAEDVVNEAFTRLWGRWETFDPHTEPALLAWTRKTIRFMSYDRNREIAETKTVELGDWIAEEESSGSGVYLAEDSVFTEILYQNYIDQIQKMLSPKQRLIFEYIILKKQDVPTVAKLLNRREHSVRVALSRLRSQLKNEILPEILR